MKALNDFQAEILKLLHLQQRPGEERRYVTHVTLDMRSNSLPMVQVEYAEDPNIYEYEWRPDRLALVATVYRDIAR